MRVGVQEFREGARADPFLLNTLGIATVGTVDATGTRVRVASTVPDAELTGHIASVRPASATASQICASI